MIGHDRFLRAAELFGGDQFIISALFPSYTGKQIKEKFKKEERLRPNLFREWIAQRPKGGAAGAKERAADMLAFFQEEMNEVIDPSTHHRRRGRNGDGSGGSRVDGVDEFGLDDWASSLPSLLPPSNGGAGGGAVCASSGPKDQTSGERAETAIENIFSWIGAA
eukprot:GHVU01086188.1.p1 GENE.GHVU01086188.1~~GHVU01086188.1.p1  ORF type:complete len:164 (-),score=38.76 GHVU01086188.1:19-510(-)